MSPEFFCWQLLTFSSYFEDLLKTWRPEAFRLSQICGQPNVTVTRTNFLYFVCFFILLLFYLGGGVTADSVKTTWNLLCLVHVLHTELPAHTLPKPAAMPCSASSLQSRFCVVTQWRSKYYQLSLFYHKANEVWHWSRIKNCFSKTFFFFFLWRLTKPKPHVFNGVPWAQKGKLKWKVVEVHIILRSFPWINYEG